MEKTMNPEWTEKGLTECEQQVMKCIWNAEGDLSLQEITARVNECYHKAWKPQTVSTFLSRLVKKAYLSMYRSGRRFFYHPDISEEIYKAKSVIHCISFWCGDDAGELLRVLRDARGLREDEKQKIQQMIL